MRALADAEEPEDSSVLSSDELTPDNTTDMMLSADFSHTCIEDMLPDPVHIFRLWQIYIDRVNPLTKIIHVPTVQPQVVEITTNLANVSLPYQALLFSIFCMAVVSLDETETNQLLGTSRDKAIQTFSAGAKAALVRFNFMKNYDMVSIQAFLIYLVCQGQSFLFFFFSFLSFFLSFLLSSFFPQSLLSYCFW
jgi:hypothetical protein